MAQLAQCLRLDLADTLTRNVELFADFSRVRACRQAIRNKLDNLAPTVGPATQAQTSLSRRIENAAESEGDSAVSSSMKSPR